MLCVIKKKVVLSDKKVGYKHHAFYGSFILGKLQTIHSVTIMNFDYRIFKKVSRLKCILHIY